MSSKTPRPTRRYPPATLKSANAATSPETPTPRFPPREKHFIATPFYTIEARARSFEGQLLNGVTPLQLARNGFYYEPNGPFSDMACCFACQAFVRLGSFQRQTLQERQKLHANDCVWKVIYDELKRALESTEIPHPSTNALPPPRQPISSHHPSIENEPPKKTTIDASTQTLAQSTSTVPTTAQKPSNSNPESRAQATLATTDPEPQQPPTAHSPQPHQTTPSITSSPQTKQTTYASVLQRPVTSIPQPTPPVQEPFLPAKPILTIEDLHLRFHNKPSPFQLENETSQRPLKRTRNKTASVTQSLSRFLASALPAFSRFLTGMQPKSDTSYPSHPQFHYSRAMRAA
ncbi:hypothetical protein N7520_001748 [Penicillium odoratum]|uniref:uncharacterized protein n=1 Tax=Penicillium odoratum TaxID=1167516 RepID=UPI002548CFB8|nr:uncharacterized protein N7520_001748 [Penicillium odoratum]KAJ5778502.1 hypothetical protein N7520_001748 [Penicillium odoratum]